MSETAEPLFERDDRLSRSRRWRSAETVPNHHTKTADRTSAQFAFVLTLLIPLSIFSVLYLQWHYAFQVPTNEPSRSADAAVTSANLPTRDLKVYLHPEDHLYREPSTRYFSWNITQEVISPNGVEKTAFLINGCFPGPTIEARSDDILEIEVVNFAEEGVSLHWHGLHMRGANHMDGPVGVTQCPIEPGTKFTYRVPIGEQAGTFWYHAHSEVHRGDGLYGGLVVHNPSTEEASTYRYDEELLFLVGDWYHWPAKKLLTWFEDRTSSGVEPAPDSLLINGLGHFNCSSATKASPVNCTEVDRPWLYLDKNQSYRVRLVNVGSLAGFSFTILDSDMKAIQVDGGLPITSDIANSIGVLYPAERVDFVLTWPESATETDTEVTIELDKEYLVTFPNFALLPTQSFLISTESTSRTFANRRTELRRFNLQNAVGFPLATPLPDAKSLFMIYATVQIVNQLDDEARSFVNQTIWKAPTIPLLAAERDAWDSHQLVPWTGSQPIWIELVINNIDTTGHPFHLHGFDFYVIASFEGRNGWNAYNPFSPMPPRGGPFNLLNPIRKDTVYVPRSGYVILRLLADNEGIWALHCHVLWHQASGMTMAFQVLGDIHKGFSDSMFGKYAIQHCKG